MREVHALKHANDSGARIDLTLENSVACAGGIGVVQVVPGLAEGRNRQPVDVAGEVATLEGTLAEHVADRVDRPGHVVHECDANHAAPEHARHESEPRPRDQAADDAGQQKCHDNDDGEGVVDALQILIVANVRRVLVHGGLLFGEEPSHVGEEQSLADGLAGGSEPPR